MAESAVRFLLERLQTLLEDEARQLSGVRGEVEQVRDELEAMKAFLREADAMEDTDEGLRVWVTQVRELAYDAEDVIDHFLIRFEHPKPSGLFGRLSKISRVLKTLKARRRVASQLQKIKSRAVDVSERRKRYDHNWSSTHGGSSSTQILSALRDNARLVPEAQLVGIESQKTELLGWVLEDAEGSHGFRVMAVQGMGGLGKTTLVNQVYRDDQVKQRFQLRVWVTVSQTFDEREVLLEIVKQIGSPILEEACSRNIHSLKEEIQSFLRDKRYLIVLDDIWTINAWDSLSYAFLESNFGSRLIVTTRISDVATKVTRDSFGGNIHELAPLSEENSWHLFCARVFHGEQCPDHLLEDSRLILERCKGLPLAIVSISGLLASKHASKEEWLRVRRNLEGELFGNDQLSDMEKILSLSFNDLPYHLKSCVLYLSMFPEDMLYGKGYIAKLWIAEGFVQQMGTATPEEVADMYFYELFNRSLIKMVEKGFRGEDYSKFHVHDLVREVLLRKSKNQNFAATFNEQNLVVPKGVRRVSIGTSLEKLMQGDRDFSRLRSLIFIPSKGSIISSTSVSELLSNCGVRLLKVFACSYLALDTFPKFITTQYGLRYLDLSDTKVTTIPSTIGRLRNLETLILSDTLVEELPNEILQIRGLRHLIAYRTNSEGSSIGVKVPTRIHTLTSLQTLSVIKVSECGLEFVKSLGKLKQLQDLRVQELREEHGPVFCSSIEQMSHLRELRMKSTDDNEILDLQYISSPPPNLERLHVNGSLTKVPSCLSDKLKSLALLSFKNCRLLVDPLESLQALPSLLLIEFLDSSYDGDELSFRAGGFKMLKKLRCVSLGKLRGVTIEEGSLPSLESLYLKNCKLLEEVPSGIEFLANLEKIYFIDMGDQFFTRLRSQNEDSDFRKIKHVPNRVVGSYDADENWEPIEFED